MIEWHATRSRRGNQIDDGFVHQQSRSCVGGGRSVADISGNGGAIADLYRTHFMRRFRKGREAASHTRIRNQVGHHGPGADSKAGAGFLYVRVKSSHSF